MESNAFEREFNPGDLRRAELAELGRGWYDPNYGLTVYMGAIDEPDPDNFVAVTVFDSDVFVVMDRASPRIEMDLELERKVRISTVLILSARLSKLFYVGASWLSMYTSRMSGEQRP